MADTTVEALEAYAGQLSEAATMATAAATTQREIINGPADSDVMTESGPVPTYAKQAVQAQAKVTAVLEEVSTGLAGASSFDSIEEGLAATTEGGSFSVRDPSSDIYLTSYVNRGGVATDAKRYPSADALDRVASSIRQNYSASRPFFTVEDEGGYPAFSVSPGQIASQGLLLDGESLDAEGYTASMTSDAIVIQDLYGYCVVRFGREEMQLLDQVREKLLNAPEAVASYPPMAMSSRKIIAHRGLHYKDLAPENSLDAYRMAARAGFKFVETDVLRTADGNYVLCHDATINRTFMNVDGTSIVGDVTVNSTTLSDLRTKYKAKSPIFRYQRPIPTLAEFLDVCVEYGLFPLIELKDPSFTSPDFVAVNDLCVSVLGSQFEFISGSPARLTAARAVNANVELGYVYSALSESVYQYIVQNQPAFLDVDYNALTAEWVARARKDGIKVAAWTVPASDYSAVSKIGAEYIAGDELAPPLQSQMVLFSNNSAGSFDAYSTTGTVVDGAVTLAAGQALNFAWKDVIDFGGLYLCIEYKGAATIAVDDSSRAVSSDSRAVYRVQKLIAGAKPSFSIVAGAGGCTVSEVSLSVAKY